MQSFSPIHFFPCNSVTFIFCICNTHQTFIHQWNMFQLIKPWLLNPLLITFHLITSWSATSWSLTPWQIIPHSLSPQFITTESCIPWLIKLQLFTQKNHTFTDLTWTKQIPFLHSPSNNISSIHALPNHVPNTNYNCLLMIVENALINHMKLVKHLLMHLIHHNFIQKSWNANMSQSMVVLHKRN